MNLQFLFRYVDRTRKKYTEHLRNKYFMYMNFVIYIHIRGYIFIYIYIYIYIYINVYNCTIMDGLILIVYLVHIMYCSLCMD
jgi:hypothetical protein